MIRNCLFLFVLLVSVSCGNNDKAEAILKPQKMQQVLWDIIKAEAYTAELVKTDSTKNAANENLKMQKEIFSIHKITPKDFYTSYDYYKNNSAVFKVMLDSMIMQANRKKNYNNKNLQVQ